MLNGRYGSDMLEFYKNKKVLITGHTGFKGSWLSKVLLMSGAQLCGLSKKTNTNPNLFNILELEKHMVSIIGDMRNYQVVERTIQEFKPEIIFHLAAQPIVIESYRNPRDTFETNVMGTVNLLEASRKCNSVKSIINITTDKVYENKEWEWPYRENERLNGYDPYSNSKSCSELVTSSYVNSFFSKNKKIGVSTARAGNVIGGGDFAADRIVPDCIRSAIGGMNVMIRNPYSIRPYQHVFEAISAYLLLAERQYENNNYMGSYNIGPNEEGCVTTKYLAEKFCELWGDNLKWESIQLQEKVHESNFLKLDCSKIRTKIGWVPILNIDDAIRLTIEWTKEFYYGRDIINLSERQIKEYFGGKVDV